MMKRMRYVILGAIPGAINIRLGDLRSRLGELDKSKGGCVRATLAQQKPQKPLPPAKRTRAHLSNSPTLGS